MTRPKYPAPSRLLTFYASSETVLVGLVNNTIFTTLSDYPDYIYTEILSLQIIDQNGGFSVFVLYKIEKDYISLLQ